MPLRHICKGSASWKSRRAITFRSQHVWRTWVIWFYAQHSFGAKDPFMATRQNCLLSLVSVWMGKRLWRVVGVGGWNYWSDRLYSDRRLEISCAGSHWIDWNSFLNGKVLWFSTLFLMCILHIINCLYIFMFVNVNLYYKLFYLL